MLCIRNTLRQVDSVVSEVRWKSLTLEKIFLNVLFAEHYHKRLNRYDEAERETKKILQRNLLNRALNHNNPQDISFVSRRCDGNVMCGT